MMIKKFSKLALHSVAAVAAMGVFMCGATQTAAAEEWNTPLFTAEASKQFPTVIANDSSQTIVKLLVRDRDSDCIQIWSDGSSKKEVYDWEKIEQKAEYDLERRLVLNIAPGQWAQHNFSQNKMISDSIGEENSQRLVDVQVTLADGRMLELDKIDICTQDVVLTDAGLKVINIAKTPSTVPADVNAGSTYFHNQQPQGRKAAEPPKDIPKGYAMVGGQLVKWE